MIMSFEPWMLAMMDDVGCFGITDEHIEKVAAKLLDTGKTDIDYRTFCDACHNCGIDPDNFNREDLEELQSWLNKE